MSSQSAKSLSTPLARGTLALPMLLMFAVLGVTALRAEPIEPVQAVRAQLIERICEGVATAPDLVVAQVPADLGQLVIRWQRPCQG